MAQGLGILAFTLVITSLQARTRQKALALIVAANSALALQYALAGAMVGMALAAIAVISRTLFFGYEKKNLKPSVTLFVCFQSITIVMAVITWEDWFSLFALLAMTVTLYAQWQTSMKWLRILTIVGAILRSAYNFHVETYTIILIDAFVVASSVIALWRYKTTEIAD